MQFPKNISQICLVSPVKQPGTVGMRGITLGNENSTNRSNYATSFQLHGPDRQRALPLVW